MPVGGRKEFSILSDLAQFPFAPGAVGDAGHKSRLGAWVAQKSRTMVLASMERSKGPVQYPIRGLLELLC
jgi:hypothetical protein